MGAKKKNKNNKLAKMSEEEKIRYLQHKAAIKEEARRRKEQLISTFLKNKLKREQIFLRLNVAKINQQWRQTLRQMKCTELSQDLKDLIKWFDYTVDKKTQIIKMVLYDLDVAENQYSQMYWCQMKTFDKLTVIHDRRIDHFYTQYKKEKDAIYLKALTEIKDIKMSYMKDEEQLKATLYRMEESFGEKTSALTCKHLSKMDELRNNMLTDLENLKNSRESKIEKIWQELQTVIKKHWEQTEDRRKEYLVMREIDYENCKQIFENNQQINGIIDVLMSLKEQLTKAQTSSQQKILNQKNNKEKSRKFFFELKKEVLSEIKCDKENLNFMNCAATKATDELKTILAKGEQILHLLNLCTKLETVNEKAPSVRRDKFKRNEEENGLDEDLKKCFEPLAEGVDNEIINFDEFWKRYNEVLLEKEALSLHYKFLINEKKQLKSILKNYFSNCVVKQPESKISYANGVQFYQRRPSTTIPSVRKNLEFVAPYTEASHIFKNRQMISGSARRSF